VARQANLSKNQ